MKKLLFLGAMAAMLLGTASCSNDMEPAMTDDGTVQFTIELPGNVDSRANISDGLTATELQVAVYKEDGTHLNLDQTVTMSNKTATVTFKLVKGMTYKFAFWAQKPGCEAYAFDASTGKVTVDYSKAVANVDDGDAFSNTATLTVTGPMTETIYLYRPFAQLNYGDVMADYTAATAAGIDFSKTQVTVKQVATSFDIMSQTTSGENLVDVTWPAAASAIGENLNVENVDYKWLSMCYFLVPSDESNVETELALLNTAGTAFNTIKVSNVPVQKNHRTNILGNLFTDDVNFNIIIDERFDQPDNNIFYPYLTDAAAIAEAIKTPGAVVNVAPGMELELDLSTIAEGVTINGNSSVLHFTTASTTAAHTLSSENVKFNDLKIINDDTEAAINVRASNASFNNVELVKKPRVGFEIYGGNTEGLISFNNCNLVTNDNYTLRPQTSCTSKVVVKDCLVQGLYTINGNGNNGDIEVTNSTLNGWTSYGKADGRTASFTNCKFGFNDRGLSTLCPHRDTQVTNCVFEWRGESAWSPCEHTVLMPRYESTTTFVGCKWSTGESLDSRVLAPDADNTYIGCLAIIDGMTWKNLVVDGVQKWVQQ